MATALAMVLTEPKVRSVEVNVFMIMISRVMFVISGAKGLQHVVLLSSGNDKLWRVLELCYIPYLLTCNQASVTMDTYFVSRTSVLVPANGWQTHCLCESCQHINVSGMLAVAA